MLRQSMLVPWDSLKNIDEVEHVDLTVDGADEVDGAFNESKVAVQTLLMEKLLRSIVKIASDCWWIQSSWNARAFKLPVEVVQYGSENLFRLFESGYRQVSEWVMVKNLRRIWKLYYWPVYIGLKVSCIGGRIGSDSGSCWTWSLYWFKVIVGTPDGPQIVEK